MPLEPKNIYDRNNDQKMEHQFSPGLLGKTEDFKRKNIKILEY